MPLISDVTAVTLGGEAVTLNSVVDDVINISVPEDINIEWDEKHDLVIYHDAGEVTTVSNVTAAAPSGWTEVVSDGTGTTTPNSLAKAFLDVFGVTVTSGDIYAHTHTGTVGADGVPDPIGPFRARLWIATLSQWTEEIPMSVIMTAQSIAVGDNWVKVGNDYVGDNPSGSTSGGNAALGWSAPSGLSDGNTLTITTDGTYSFGTRVNASPIWWQRGAVAYNRSGEVTLLEAGLSDGDTLSEGVNADAFSVCDSLTARTGLGERSGFGYESSSNSAKIGGFQGTSLNQVATTRKASWGFTARYSWDLSLVRSSSFSSSTGTFDDGDHTAFVLGETFTGTKGTGGGFTGTMIKFDTINNVATYIVDGSYNSSDNNGATITGDTSGATATFDGVVYVGGRSTKLTRSSTNPSVTPTAPDVALNYTVVASSQNIVQMVSSAFATDDQRPNGLKVPNSDWHDLAFFADYSGATYDVGHSVDGSLYSYTHTNTNSVDLTNVPYQFYHSIFACDWGGSDNGYGHLIVQVKDPYADDELAGVYVGDEATLSSCTKLVYARSTAWSDASATAQISFGEIPAGTTAYLYVRDDAGAFVSASGVSIGEIG